MKKYLANIALMLAVTLICLVIAEIGLRALTPFPIHGETANKIYDRDFGSRLNPNHPSIDANGFRNAGDKPRVVAAIGDSHTYGSGVGINESWPALFEKAVGLPTYNFGIGSYAVYTYYAVARHAIDQGYKHVIIALYIHNDFTPYGTNCDIDYARSEFWQQAKADLSLNLPRCRLEDTWKTADAPPFIRWLRGREISAILSATDYLVLRPLSDWWHRLSFGRTGGGQPRKQGDPGILVSPARAAEKAAPEEQENRKPASWYFSARGLKLQREELRSSDPDNPVTREILEDFERMLADLGRITAEKGITFGLLFLPSKVVLAYEHAADRDVFEREPWLRRMVSNQTAVQERLAAFLDEQGIAWRSAKPELLAAMDEAERAGGAVFGSTGNHPDADGYRAYAEAAVKLFEQMRRR